jgi:histidine triad (HIT) family protein
MMAENIFQKIIDRKIPARIVYEDEQCLAFHDINPQAPVHILIIPKKAIALHSDIDASDGPLLGHLHLVARRLAEELKIHRGYRLVINCGDDGGQTVPHLHMHLLGGRTFHWPPG